MATQTRKQSNPAPRHLKSPETPKGASRQEVTAAHRRKHQAERKRPRRRSNSERLYYEKLLPYTIVTRQEKADHVNQILYQQHNMPKCPYCGSNLVIRTARSGPREGKKFYGCSNYPNCHYLQNID